VALPEKKLLPGVFLSASADAMRPVMGKEAAALDDSERNLEPDQDLKVSDILVRLGVDDDAVKVPEDGAQRPLRAAGS
jgi:hypothetical protein